jgi:hypothetical protein
MNKNLMLATVSAVIFKMSVLRVIEDATTLNQTWIGSTTAVQLLDLEWARNFNDYFLVSWIDYLSILITFITTDVDWHRL